VTEGKQKITLRIPNSDQGILNSVYKNATVTEVSYGDEYVTVRAVADSKARGMFGRYIAE
jgi:50S ribosomal subunit-associated GTPase HflX